MQIHKSVNVTTLCSMFNDMQNNINKYMSEAQYYLYFDYLKI